MTAPSASPCARTAGGRRWWAASSPACPTAAGSSTSAPARARSRWRSPPRAPVSRSWRSTGVPTRPRPPRRSRGPSGGRGPGGLRTRRPRVAVDGDPDALALARAKPGAERVTWAEGLADALPMADGGVDAAVFSLVLHHLGPATQRRALAEVARALRPGGRLLVADWGRPDGLLTRASFLLLRAIDGFAATRAHARGELPTLIGAAGFSPVRRLARLRRGGGALELLGATGR